MVLSAVSLIVVDLVVGVVWGDRDEDLDGGFFGSVAGCWSEGDDRGEGRKHVNVHNVQEAFAAQNSAGTPVGQALS